MAQGQGHSLRTLSNIGKSMLASGLSETKEDVAHGDLLGKAVRVFWTKEDAWFKGKVVDQRLSDGEYVEKRREA